MFVESGHESTCGPPLVEAISVGGNARDERGGRVVLLVLVLIDGSLTNGSNVGFHQPNLPGIDIEQRNTQFGQLKQLKVLKRWLSFVLHQGAFNVVRECSNGPNDLGKAVINLHWSMNVIEAVIGDVLLLLSDSLVGAVSFFVGFEHLELVFAFWSFLHSGKFEML